RSAQEGGSAVERPAEHRTSIEAELCTPLATTWVIHFDLAEPSDDIFHEADAYWLDVCVTPRPRNSRACYPEHWLRDRFEPIGDVFVVPPGEVLHARSDRGRQTSIVCQLPAAPIRALLDEDLEWTDRRLEACLDISHRSLRNMVLRLGEEARRPGF